MEGQSRVQPARAQGTFEHCCHTHGGILGPGVGLNDSYVPLPSQDILLLCDSRIPLWHVGGQDHAPKGRTRPYLDFQGERMFYFEY